MGANVVFKAVICVGVSPRSSITMGDTGLSRTAFKLNIPTIRITPTVKIADFHEVSEAKLNRLSVCLVVIDPPLITYYHFKKKKPLYLF